LEKSFGCVLNGGFIGTNDGLMRDEAFVDDLFDGAGFPVHGWGYPVRG
jgi:hypothetical protein